MASDDDVHVCCNNGRCFQSDFITCPQPYCCNARTKKCFKNDSDMPCSVLKQSGDLQSHVTANKYCCDPVTKYCFPNTDNDPCPLYSLRQSASDKEPQTAQDPVPRCCDPEGWCFDCLTSPEAQDGGVGVNYCYNPNTGLCGYNFTNLPCQAPCQKVDICNTPVKMMYSCGLGGANKSRKASRACKKALKEHKSRMALARWLQQVKSN